MGKEIVPLEYKFDNKEFIKLYKLVFSSLFMRKQNVVYLDKAKPHEAYFTSVTPVTLLINKPNYTDNFHKVVCHNGETDFIKLLSGYIDLDQYDSQYICIDISKLSTLIRQAVLAEKSVDELKVLQTNQIPSAVTYKVSKKIDKVATLLDEVVIYLISDIELSYIQDIMLTVTDWVKHADGNNTLLLDTKSIYKSDVNFFITKDLFKGDGVLVGGGLKLPFMDGVTGVATNEYIKKIKDPDHTTYIIAGQKGNVLRYYFKHHNNVLDVLSITPATFLLCKKKII